MACRGGGQRRKRLARGTTLPNKEAGADEPESRGGEVPRDGRGAGQVGTAWDEPGNHGLEEEAKDGEIVEPADPCCGRAGQAQYRSTAFALEMGLPRIAGMPILRGA